VSDLRIPLFPLNVVLFPGMELPLKVFEERYQVMLDEVLTPEAVALVQEAFPEERVAAPPAVGYFGVVLTEDPEVGTEAEPELVGTLARITRVDPPDTTRTLDTVGLQRFRIDRVHRNRPFLEADVTFLEDPHEPGVDVTAEAERAKAAFTAYVEAMVGAAPPEFGKALLAISPHVFRASPEDAGYCIGEALLVPLEEKQALLMTDGAGRRLALATRILEREVRKSRLMVWARNAHLN